MKAIFLIMFVVIAAGCSKSKSIPGDHGADSALKNKTFFEEVGVVEPYRPGAAYSATAVKCVYSITEKDACTASELPLLGLKEGKITIEDILNRTLVSHQFLGNSFREALSRMNPEMLKMFGAVTAVVISDKINPSFYYNASGAIYLSGRYFWRNLEEWKLLTQVKDFREGSGMPFQFQFDSDYIKDGKSIGHRVFDDEQNYDEMSLKLARLLFHELAHANDFFPSTFYKDSAFDMEKTYLQMSEERYEKKENLSHKLPSSPGSITLNHVGQVLYQGEKASAEDSLLTAEQVAQEISNDVVSDAYAYSTPMEDLAMLAEEALMLHFYNMPRYTFVIKLPSAFFKIPKDFDYPIAYGQKSKIAEAVIKPRAVFAIDSLIGREMADEISALLDRTTPVQYPENTSWETIYQ